MRAARWEYSGLFAKNSRSLRRAVIMSAFLLMSCWERFTTPIHGCCRRYDLPSKTYEIHRRGLLVSSDGKGLKAGSHSQLNRMFLILLFNTQDSDSPSSFLGCLLTGFQRFD
jgi:hypothetical protein